MRYVKIITIVCSTCVLASLLLVSVTQGQERRPARTARGAVRLPEEAREVSPAPPAEEAKEAKPEAPPGEEMVYLNVQDQDIKDVIKQISKATGKNFIIDDKVRGKVTIMSEKMMTKEEAYQAFLSALEVAGYTTVIGPGGIIKIVSLKEAVAAPIPIHVDSTPYTDSYVTRLISLQNISALEMSTAIKGLISKSGNMFAYPATNTLIITDSGTNIDRLMKIIKELDQEGPQQVLEIIPINYADATEVAQMVLSLFEIEKAQAARRVPRRRAAAAELEEIQDVSKIIADERTNSLIVLASKRAIDKVREIIAKLDVPLEAEATGKIHVHYLKYANATELAQTLSAITTGAQRAAAKQVPKGAKGPEAAVAQLEGGISIGADESTNALIITASARDYKLLVDELISKLDIPRRQVYLEAVVMELDVQRGSNIGVSGFGGGGPGSFLGFGSMGSPAALLDPTSFFTLPGLIGGVLSRDTVTFDVPKSGGGTTEVTVPAFGAFLSLLQTYRNSNIVSTPNILTLDNQKAVIEVIKTIYAKRQTTVATAGTLTVEPTPLETGLTLEITPQISEGDAVRLEILHKLSNFTGPPDELTGAAPSTKREVQTTVMAMDGQTVVLGGLMQDSDTVQRDKVPILGDIPLLGLLFRKTTKGNLKNNLIIFITPHVIRDPSDFAEITKAKIEQRNLFIDKNFGKRQRRVIRDTIAMHRADLLEYVPPPAAKPPVPAKPSPPAVSPPQAKAPPPAPEAQAPVITVPPVGRTYRRGAAPESTRPKSVTPPAVKPRSPQLKDAGDLDLAY
jgi:general secretion pathway protein D